VHLRSNFWFEDEGDILVIGIDITDGQPRSSYGVETNFAYSIRDSVTWGALSFLIMRTFRGGDGHIKESKSLVGLSIQRQWSSNRCGQTYLGIWELFYPLNSPHLGSLSSPMYC
jgi:hypothetical protein